MILVTGENLGKVAASLQSKPQTEAERLEAYYRKAGADPTLVVIRRPQGAWIAFVGEEPTSREERNRMRSELGHGGAGFVLVDVEGESSVTHNLQADHFVPQAYSFLLPAATHVRMKPLTLEEDERHWKALAWAEREAA